MSHCHLDFCIENRTLLFSSLKLPLPPNQFLLRSHPPDPQAARLHSWKLSNLSLQFIDFYHDLLPNVSQICPIRTIFVQVLTAYLDAFNDLQGLCVSHYLSSNKRVKMPLGSYPPALLQTPEILHSLFPGTEPPAQFPSYVPCDLLSHFP